MGTLLLNHAIEALGVLMLASGDKTKKEAAKEESNSSRYNSSKRDAL